MEEGNLREYLKRMVKADRVALVSDTIQLMSGDTYQAY
jgi:hypothetical protein